MKNKIFTSTNSKKGLLVEVGEDHLKLSIWKKETPISIEIDKTKGNEIVNFLSAELLEDCTNDDEKYWNTYTKNFIEERVGKFPKELEGLNKDTEQD